MHYYLIHLYSRLTSLVFSSCSVLGLQRNLSCSSHPSTSHCLFLLPHQFQVLCVVWWLRLFPHTLLKGDLTKSWDLPFNLLSALDKAVLSAIGRPVGHSGSVAWSCVLNKMSFPWIISEPWILTLPPHLFYFFNPLVVPLNRRYAFHIPFLLAFSRAFRAWQIC